MKIKALSLVLGANLTYGTIAYAQLFGIRYGGRIADPDGSPASGTLSFSVRFFDQQADGAPIGPSLAVPNVTVKDGVFTFVLPLSEAQQHEVFGAVTSPWIELKNTVTGKIYPRQLFSAVPYALKVPVDPAVFAYDANGKLTLSAPPEDGKVLSSSGGSLQWIAQQSGGSNLTLEGSADSKLTIKNGDNHSYDLALAGSGNSFPGRRASPRGCSYQYQRCH